MDFFEMFISEYMRTRSAKREAIQERIAKLVGGGMNTQTAEIQASKEVLGKEVRGFKGAFNNAIFEQFAVDQVSKRASMLGAELHGRVGARSLGGAPDKTTVVDAVRKLPNLQFASESTGLYHPNKHTLPPDHQKSSYATDEVSRYLKSANETIRNGVAEKQHSPDGGCLISFTARYPGKTMRAIVRVNIGGDAVIAAYGDAP